MNSKASEIEFFVDLTQVQLESTIHDQHNDYCCAIIVLENAVLLLEFVHIVSGNKIDFRFEDTIVDRFRLEDFAELANLTIDKLYRGRCERNGTLLDNDREERSYFYIQFCEGMHFEIWSKSVSVQQGLKDELPS